MNPPLSSKDLAKNLPTAEKWQKDTALAWEAWNGIKAKTFDLELIPLAERKGGNNSSSVPQSSSSVGEPASATSTSDVIPKISNKGISYI